MYLENSPSINYASQQIQGYDNITFNIVVEQWVTQQKILVKESTLATYCTIIKKHLLPELNEFPLAQTNVEFLNQFAVRKMMQGLSPKYIRDILTVLRAILNFASQVYGTHTPHRISSLPKAPVKNVKTLSEADRRRLEHLAFHSSDFREQGILLCLYTGLRIGELCALRWSDFSLDKTTISVKRTLQRIVNTSDSGPKSKIIVTDPKTGSSTREIPLPQFLVFHYQELSSRLPSSAYFLTGDTERHMEPRTYQDFFMRYLRRQGFDPINFHALRHTFATRCIKEGFDPKSLSEILGHANVEITLNRYVHIGMETKQKYMNLLTM